MQILCVDSDSQHARELYEQFLSYRGVKWGMTHCKTVHESAEHAQRDHFDVVLLSMSEEERVSGRYSGFVQRTSYETPVVVLSDSGALTDQRELIRAGAEDCLGRNSTGDFVMRRMQLAVSRFHHMRKVPSSILAESTSGRRDSDRQSSQRTPDVSASAGPSQRLRLLRIDDLATDSAFDTTTEGAEAVEQAISLKAAVELLREQVATQDENFDAIVINQNVLEREGPQRLVELQQELAATPIIALMVDRSDRVAVSYVNAGVDDCLVTAATSWKRLEQTIELCRQRRCGLVSRRETAGEQSQLDRSDRRKKSRTDDRDRRATTRYMITRPVLAIPVLPDGSPDEANICDAFTLDLSTGGVSFQAATQQVVPSRNWVLGFEADASKSHEWDYINVLIRNVSDVSGGLRFGAAFAHAEDDLFRVSNRMPWLSPETCRMTTGLPDRVLRRWEKLGVMQRDLLKRLKSCPECAAVALVSDGCRDCGSSVVAFRELIHHFACAYVDDASTFDSGDGMRCPKCLMKGLVAGADFEVIKAQYECSCGYSGSQLEQVGTCMNCHLNFPLRMARDEEVYGYHVHAMDILAFLSSTT